MNASSRRKKRWMRYTKFCVKCLAFALAGLLLFALFTPSILRAHKKMEMTQSISNSKQIYLVLMDFESDFGEFPSDLTTANRPLHAFKGDSSNAYLGQLIAGGYTTSEEIFFAFDKRYRKSPPDDDIAPPERILETNENGFSYVMTESKARKEGFSTSDNGGIPILVAPLVDATGVFETRSYKNSGVYLRVDGSARCERLDQNGRLKLKGKTLFENGDNTVWGTVKPIVLLPKR